MRKCYRSVARCANRLLSYYSLHEQAILLSYRAEEGDIPESPLWVPGLKKKKKKESLIEWKIKIWELWKHKQVLPLTQTVIKVNVTLRSNLSIHCIRLRR